ncbi:MAG: hypothetical protein CMB32_01955 [Euryarchaeota archaeon]|nr:hypothetical protein [Euryarchaeota archaeon]
MNLRTNTFILTALLFLSTSVSAQFTFLTSKTEISGDVSFIEIDVPTIEEDELNGKNGDYFEFAKIIELDIDLFEQGEKTELINGSVWRLGIQSTGAKAISLYYDEFNIPFGGELIIYNPSQDQIAGPFTYEDVHTSGLYATELIEGDKIILEYFQPNYQQQLPSINIEKLAYAYKSGGIGFGASQDCEVNANCPEGNNWDDQKKSTCRIQIISGGGAGFCSGALINNTANNCTPYVLSADHCFNGGNISSSYLNQCIFYFNFLSNGCSNPGTSPGYDAITGCSLVSNSGGEGSNGDSDFFLVQLNSAPDFNPYFAGWNRSSSPSSSGVSLHHPAGDIMKISTYTSTLQSAGGLGGGGNNNTHWLVYWAQTVTDQGVTEGGSSGSPIFDSNGLIIGDLTGGSSYCWSPNNPDIYGKLWYSWDQMGNNSNDQLKPWLDPNNTGVMTHPGMYCGGAPGCTDPEAINYDPDAIVDDGSCEYPCFANEVTLAFLPDCYGIEISWEIEDSNGNTIYSVGEGFYQGGNTATTMNPEPQVFEHSWCLTNGCYTFTVNDSYGDGMNGEQFSCGLNGDYDIIGSDGNILASLIATDANYEFSESNEFCVNSEVNPTWNCTNGDCDDPGDGSGQYSSESACINACTSASESWDCMNGDCYDPGDGSGEFSNLNSCVSNCVVIPITWTCENGDCYNPGDGSGEYDSEAWCISACTIIEPSYDCMSGECYDPEDGNGEFMSLLACNAACGSIVESWNCISGECIDPGDGSGQYDSEGWCIAECHNNSVETINQGHNRTLVKVINVLGQEVNQIVLNTPLIFIYSDGSVEKKVVFNQ